MGGFLDHLPDEVSRLIRTQLVVQYATVSAAGVPIDTPTGVFTSQDLTTLDIATGVAYPAKAERVRRNPKVGLLIEAGEDKPVISIAGMGAVRDADLQANLERYMAEAVFAPGPTAMKDWSITRQAIWYYTRIFVCITPVHIRWWPNRAAMDKAPLSWRAPAGSAFPPSDPAPQGKPSPAPEWPQRPWAELAAGAIARNAPGHLTLLNADGFPLPIGVSGLAACDEGFRMTVPAGAPWRAGKASLCFQGAEMFVGDAMPDGDQMLLRVERALPLFPLTTDVSKVLQPDPETRATLLHRLAEEAARRGQPIPTMLRDKPAPTAGAQYRADRLAGV